MTNMAKILNTRFGDLDFDQLASAPIEAIAGIRPSDARLLRKMFCAKTIGELGSNKYIVAAVAIAAIAGAGASSIDNDDSRIARHIETDRLQLGPAEARLTNSGVSVWAIAGYAPLVDWNAEAIAADYGLTLDEVEAALAYYRRHRDAIEARIAANTITAA
jgi:uncharacterized protein (DUF433 family)